MIIIHEKISKIQRSIPLYSVKFQVHLLVSIVNNFPMFNNNHYHNRPPYRWSIMVFIIMISEVEKILQKLM